jgi:hypothetical protein
MSKIECHVARTLLAVTFIVWGSRLRIAQSATAPPNQAEVELPSDDSIADLDLVGVEVALPPLSDSLVSRDSNYRRAMFRKGMALRFVTYTQYVQNTLDAPVAPDEQVYTGQRPFEYGIAQPMLTADLRQLHLAKHS